VALDQANKFEFLKVLNMISIRVREFSPCILRNAIATLAVSLLATLAATRPAFAQTESVLYNFCSLANCADGEQPRGNIVRDSAGNIYGTTEAGGQFGQGVLYRVSLAGVETVLHNFGSTADDGQIPNGLAADSAGNLYGTTQYGGSHVVYGLGRGTVFKMTPAGAYSILYNFGATATDGQNPFAGVVVDAAGNLYGTTLGGGAYSDGTVYKLTPTGTETIFHSFDSNNLDGEAPRLPVTLDKKGNVLGATSYGGNRENGTIFEVSASGVYSILYNFNYLGDTTAGDPFTGLTLDAAGNLYGGSFLGGTGGESGTIYEIGHGSGKIWTEEVLIAFSSNDSGYYYPRSGVTFDSQGNMYGTAELGGALGYGGVWEQTAGGELQSVFNFNYTDGSNPASNLILDSEGNLYGTTPFGGSSTVFNGGGVLYEVTP
jgi:uncharacterized repeat protein (TIGR03803 family)